MDEITKQIQQLKVTTTNRHKCGDPPAFIKDTSSKVNLDDTIDCRKSAPSVPPKPTKKSPNYLEVFMQIDIFHSFLCNDIII